MPLPISNRSTIFVPVAIQHAPVAPFPRFAVAFQTVIVIGGVLAYARLVAPVDFLVVAHVRAEGRIGDDDIETLREDAVNIDKAVMVVNAVMTVAVHNHIHLGGARGAGFGVATEDAAPSELADAGIYWLVLIV